MVVDVLFVFPHRSTFIDQDFRILESEFTVEPMRYAKRSDRIRLVPAILRAKLVLAWFVLGSSYAAIRLGQLVPRRVLLMAGGWDVEALPDLGYGAMLSSKQARRTAFVLSRADRVLAVSEYTRRRVLSWSPKANCSVTYHGFDPLRFSPSGDDRHGVLTVARVAPETFMLKGLGTLFEVARQMPDVAFTIVGETSEGQGLVAQAPSNVHFKGRLSQDELVEEYRRTKVYAQLSAVESFGCSLAEAMLCGCVPVVTDRGALPEVVGTCGGRAPFGDVPRTIEAIQVALESNDGSRCRDQIVREFPLTRRKQAIVEEVAHLLEGRR